ncbi:uncharacterized protein PV09_01246 [Verruconis gallopava]|uniref:polynucleotide adenylyltransferase n=1 Tax=Verruconis gallopava TaxID=253628 RepID=A0A0D2BAG7_9PEZI|nr:uncharacterized protein PV09_01246 [Verruconis gallopava]KIW08329.1 hypothetical protein PV09_01246 [Verruconis gallopava]
MSFNGPKAISTSNMPKGKRTQETKDLEDQLRSMILGNVRINSENTPQGRPARGRGRDSHVALSMQHTTSNISPGPSFIEGGSQPSPSYNRNGHSSGPQDGEYSLQNPHGNHRNQGSGNFQGLRSRGQHYSHPSPRDRGSTGGTVHPNLYDPSQSPQNQRSPRRTQSQSLSSPGAGPGGHRNAVPTIAAFIAQCELLDILAAEEIPKIEMSQAEFLQKEAFRARLEDICREEIQKEYPDLTTVPNLRAYGSIVSGFATKGSDVDLTIVWSGPSRDDPEFKAKLPRVVELAILKAGHGARLLSRTRVPIIKVCEQPTEDLYAALTEERQRWEELPEEEKYPELTPPPESPVERDNSSKFALNEDDAVPEARVPLDVDHHVSRGGRKMEVTKRITMNDDPVGFLLQLKTKRRTEDEDLTRYCTQFINARRFSLQASDIDDQTYAEWFLEGLPTSVVKSIVDNRSVQLKSDASFTDHTLFEQYYEVAQPIIASLNTARGKKERPWLREKALGKLDFPKSGVGIQCDINFSNPLGMHNTELLRLYSLCDSRVRPFVLFVKAWTKRRKINSAYNGTLSSYGYVLMVLHFLINIAQPPVLPNLQLVFGAGEREVLVEGGYNISFYRDEAAIRQMAATHQWTQNTEPLGVLLRNFFHYYAAQGSHVIGTGFNWMRDVISIRTPRGIMSKEWKGWTGAKTVHMDGGREVRQRYLLAIEDPFEIDHNVGRPVTHNGIVTIRDEFRRAWRILSAVGRGVEAEGGLFDNIIEQEEDKRQKVEEEHRTITAST